MHFAVIHRRTSPVLYLRVCACVLQVARSKAEQTGEDDIT